MPYFFEKDTYTQFKLSYTPENKTLWIELNCNPRPIANYTAVCEMLDIAKNIKLNKQLIDFAVTTSAHPKAFNLGGDLEMFVSKIESKDELSMRKYAHKCVELLDTINNSYYCDVISIADIHATALGGGFEFALSHNFTVAKETVRMGFPEITFGFYPGMGGYSFFKRKAEGVAKVESMILSGQSLSAKELYDIGVIDHIYTEEDSNSVNNIIADLYKKQVGLKLLLKNRNLVNPVKFDILLEITNLWVDSAFLLSAENIAHMKKLVKLQDRSVRC